MKRKTRRWIRRSVRRATLLPLLGIVAGLIARLSPRSADRLGASLGRLVFTFSGGLRARVLAHLEIAFPHLSPAARTRIGLDSLRHLAGCLMEWIVLVRRGPERAAAAVVAVEGMHHVRETLERGRGVVAVTAHFGLFELMPVYFTQRGFDACVIGRRPGDESLEGLVVEMRTSMGVPTIFQRQVRRAVRLLRDGKILGTLPDQDVDKLAGTFLPFFGKDAYTPTGPATLAATTRATLLPVFIHRLEPARHAIVIHAPIPDPGGNREERVLAMTEGWSRVFETVIARRPSHWAWIHRRWDTTPEQLARRRARRARKEARLTVERRDTGS